MFKQPVHFVPRLDSAQSPLDRSTRKGKSGNRNIAGDRRVAALSRLWFVAKLAGFALLAGGLWLTAPALRPAPVTPAPAPAPAPDRSQSLERPQRDAAQLTSVAVTRELDIPHWLQPGQYVWQPEGAPAGPAVVVVNIRARVLSVYRAGAEIGRSSLIYGADNKPTPTGTFPILEKRRDHWSNLYDAPMPHMLRLTWDGVALHGSPALADDLATRGCVGLPREFAALLFDAVEVGDQVIVWDGVTPA